MAGDGVAWIAVRDSMGRIISLERPGWKAAMPKVPEEVQSSCDKALADFSVIVTEHKPGWKLVGITKASARTGGLNNAAKEGLNADGNSVRMTRVGGAGGKTYAKNKGYDLGNYSIIVKNKPVDTDVKGLIDIALNSPYRLLYGRGIRGATAGTLNLETTAKLYGQQHTNKAKCPLFVKMMNAQKRSGCCAMSRLHLAVLLANGEALPEKASFLVRLYIADEAAVKKLVQTVAAQVKAAGKLQGSVVHTMAQLAQLKRAHGDTIASQKAKAASKKAEKAEKKRKRRDVA
jgi:hypothetical protein